MDKGSQISEDGSSADKNIIAEQLSQSKRLLLALRRKIEENRDAHLAMMSEHRRLASSLQDALEKLQSYEAACRTRPLLTLSPHSVVGEIEKHHVSS